MKRFVRKAVFGVLGAVLLCLPATVFAEPLDTGFIDDPAIHEPIESSELDQLLQDLNQPDVIESSRLSRDVVAPGRELLVSIGRDTATLEPNAPYEIFLDDISLGTFTSDYNGQLFIQVKIPYNTTGTHLLSVRSQTITIQKTVVIGRPS